jgi:hypothetical protein
MFSASPQDGRAAVVDFNFQSLRPAPGNPSLAGATSKTRRSEAASKKRLVGILEDLAGSAFR